MSEPQGRHPEEYCHRCGGSNLWSWSAPSPLWNAVMRRPGVQEIGIVCPQCFAVLAEERGVLRSGHYTWRIYPDAGLITDLPTTDPDGRTWDSDQWLWVEPVTLAVDGTEKARIVV